MPSVSSSARIETHPTSLTKFRQRLGEESFKERAIASLEGVEGLSEEFEYLRSEYC